MKLIFVFILFFNFAFAKKIDLSRFKIDLNPEEKEEWRLSTIEKIINFCIELGSSKKVCQCGADIYKKNYKENEFLKTRAKMLEMLENGEDISKNSEVMIFIEKAIVCIKNG